MTIDPLFSMAFATGLFGAGHCLGMCGNLVAALALSNGGQRGASAFHCFYHAGRATTYTGIGALAGWLGSAVAYTDTFRDFTRILLVTSDLFIIIIGLGSAGLFSALDLLEIEHRGTTQAISGFARKLIAYQSPLIAFPLGLLLGFLPCGFVYAMAITAAQSANTGSGALIMFCFALGTAPSLFLFGHIVSWLGQRARQWMLRAAGVLIAIMGGINLYRHLQLLGIV